MDIHTRLPPGVYHYSAMAAPIPNNHNPPIVRNVYDSRGVVEAFNPLPNPFRSVPDFFGINDEIFDQLMNDETIVLDQWQPNFLGQNVRRVDFSSSNNSLSEDVITKHLKTRPAAEDDRENKICVICQDCLFQEEDKIAILGCGHEYHVGCIKNWLMRKNRCPLCNGAGVLSVD